MKLSSLILLITFSILIIAMFASNILLKAEYKKIDKKDSYWNYAKILEQPFSHLKINGGNFTNIAFEQSDNPSISVFKNWEGFDNKLIKASVKSDTLFVDLSFQTHDYNEREYLKRIILVRLSAPRLLSIDGLNTSINMNKLKQESLSINLQGRSGVMVQSYLSNFKNIQISEKDSSKIIFQMSPDLKDRAKESVGTGGENMTITFLNANVYGTSSLDIGHAQIDSLKLDVSDSSAVTLSGKGLKATHKMLKTSEAKELR